MNAASWSRLQFAFTITYHYLFPQLTMGLALLIVILKALSLRASSARTLRRRRAVLGAHLRHQFLGRRRHRHSDGVPVRHELGALLGLRGRRHRPHSCARGHVRLLRGVGISRAISLRREALGPRKHFLRRVHSAAGVVVVGLLHHRHQRVHAAPGRLTHQTVAVRSSLRRRGPTC